MIGPRKRVIELLPPNFGLRALHQLDVASLLRCGIPTPEDRREATRNAILEEFANIEARFDLEEGASDYDPALLGPEARTPIELKQEQWIRWARAAGFLAADDLASPDTKKLFTEITELREPLPDVAALYPAYIQAATQTSLRRAGERLQSQGLLTKASVERFDCMHHEVGFGLRGVKPDPRAVIIPPADQVLALFLDDEIACYRVFGPLIGRVLYAVSFDEAEAKSRCGLKNSDIVERYHGIQSVSASYHIAALACD